MAVVESIALEKAQNAMHDKLCDDLDQLVNDDAPAIKARNKDLQKTKLCIYHVQGKCGLSNNCRYAHNLSEVRKPPNLAKTQLCTNFMNGKCTRDNCTYAHGEAELVKPPSFKKKMCLWYKQGKCRNGNTCGFIHNLSELSTESDPSKERQKKPTTDDDYDEASTDVSSSQSQDDSDRTMNSTRTIPEEHIFRMMARRGSAPLDHQVKSIGLAIGGLQARLSQVQGHHQAASDVVDNMNIQKQAHDIQDAINQLSSQCVSMEANLRTKQQPETHRATNQQPPAPPWRKACSNAQASHQTTLDSNDDKSGGVTRKRVPSQVKKTRPTTQSTFLHKLGASDCSSAATSMKSLRSFGTRAALSVLVLTLMATLELQQFSSK